VEEQRTNLLLRSAEFDSASWVKANSTVSPNGAVGPFGTTTMDKLVEDTSTSAHYLSQDFTITANTTYSASVFAKASTRTKIQLFWTNNTNTTGGNVIFDLSAGTAGAVNTYGTGSGYSAKIENWGNGLYRCIITGVIDNATTTGRIRVGLIDGTGAFSYTGDGSSGAFLEGADVQQGSFITSHIPTTTAQVTRTADSEVMASISSWFNAAQGTFVVEGDAPVPPSGLAYAILSADDGTGNNRIQLRRSANTFWNSIVIAGGTTSWAGTNISGNVSSSKLAIAYAANDFAATADGAVPASGGAAVPTVTQLQLGNGAGIQSLNGHIRRLRYYPTRLPNAQLQVLTQ
jgi:hypothetical protein